MENEILIGTVSLEPFGPANVGRSFWRHAAGNVASYRTIHTSHDAREEVMIMNLVGQCGHH